MNHPITRRRTIRPLRHNRGVALVISLILLVVMTIFGLAGVRLVSSEERMVAQTYDRALAFQAAESQLREAEIAIETAGQPSPVAGADCSLQGALQVCGAPAATASPRWTDAASSDWKAGSEVKVTSASGSTEITIVPDYFVEYLGDSFPCGFDPVNSADNCKRYRVTVRVNQGGGRAAVTLQSVYATS